MKRSRYHLGFSTLDRETSLDDLPVRGTVPPWLTGTLVRTAPAKFEVGDRGYKHWFDPLAMLHKFAFAAGRVSYANRYLRSQSYLEAMATGRISRGEFATDPCRTLFQRVAAWFSPKFTDNCNVSVNKLAGEVVAYTETRMPIRFDPDTLNTLGGYHHDARIKGAVSTAHPHLDYVRGPTTPTCWNSAGAASIISSGSIRRPDRRRSSPRSLPSGPRTCTRSG